MAKASLSPELIERMQRERAEQSFKRFAFDDKDALRRYDDPSDRATLWRPAFVRDKDKILYCPFYSRYADKTQVFSLYRNDDVTRRSLHVQFVSNIARTIGAALNLNTDLVEAISLGHDIGHTPFGHTGEKYLDKLFYEHAGRHFAHNIHSVRVLDKIFPFNLTVQTLNGIAAHNGEKLVPEVAPTPMDSFTEFDRTIEACNLSLTEYMKASTMEACVVRFADVIAYLGKDRQDAERTAKMLDQNSFTDGSIGSRTPEIINNLEVSIIENSYGKPYLRLDEELFVELKGAIKDNYERIYEDPLHRSLLNNLEPMMAQIYERMLDDLIHENKTSPIWTHHINYIEKMGYKREQPYHEEEPNQLVVDYIASMTDDYFVDLYRYLFPDSPYEVKYIGYFD